MKLTAGLPYLWEWEADMIECDWPLFYLQFSEDGILFTFLI